MVRPARTRHKIGLHSCARCANNLPNHQPLIYWQRTLGRYILASGRGKRWSQITSEMAFAFGTWRIAETTKKSYRNRTWREDSCERATYSPPSEAWFTTVRLLKSFLDTDLVRTNPGGPATRCNPANVNPQPLLKKRAKTAMVWLRKGNYGRFI